MSNVINLNSHGMKCAQCGHKGDCPILDENLEPTDEALLTSARILHAGDHVYRAGDAVGSLYRIRTGAVKTALPASDGGEQVTGFFGAGEWIGLDALDSATHNSTAIALDTTSVCVVPIHTILSRMSHSAASSKIILNITGRRLAQKNNLHVSLARSKASQRMAAFLLELGEQRREAGLVADNIALPMSRGEIASYLALAVETVSRLLTQMQRDGVITVNRHSVEVLDHSALVQIAGQHENQLFSEGIAATRA